MGGCEPETRQGDGGGEGIESKKEGASASPEGLVQESCPFCVELTLPLPLGLWALCTQASVSSLSYLSQNNDPHLCFRFGLCMWLSLSPFTMNKTQA